ncbi:MAG: hypothetical protein HYZ50_23230 [Deltaproteobacteria bacterium]|nr:hypothetical protein [Deltaproteobacteria bacterium]
MRGLRRSDIVFRLCAIIAFLAYLLAGASFALPPELRCARCFRNGAAITMQPGASCPWSPNGDHCDHGQNQSSGKISLCPDGCLHHDGQGGEIPSLAKFLGLSPGLRLVWVPAGSVLPSPHGFVPEADFPPPQRPPSRHI